MKKGNVLVIGNSGVGKSTLINAVLGENVAKTGWGIRGTTNKLEIYESKNNEVPFRIIDTIGFEPSPTKARIAVKAVKDWSKESAKQGKEDNQINVIWFCVEGTKRKLFPEDIKTFVKATSMWTSVPVVVVITKSYSLPERLENISMVEQAFAEQKKKSNVKTIIPVVAQIYELNEHAFAAPEGITELIEVTNKLMPEGIQAAEEDITNFILRRKRAAAQAIVGTSTAAAATIGFIPIPFADAALLTPIETAEINLLAKVYDKGKSEKDKKFINSIIEAGSIGMAAKLIIGGLKALPGIGLPMSVINAAVAGVLVSALGEISNYAFEQIYLGKKTVMDIDWLQKLIKDKFSEKNILKAQEIFEKLTDESSPKEVSNAVLDFIKLFAEKKKNH